MAEEAALVFKSVGFTRSKADQCLFTMNTPSGGMLILLVFVDDILVARADEDAEFCQQKVKAIQAQIPLLETLLAKFLGLRIQLGADFSVSLDQGHYAREILIRFKMANCAAEPLLCIRS